MEEEQLKQLKKLKTLQEEPTLALFDELEDVNDKLEALKSVLSNINNKNVKTYEEELKTLQEAILILTESVRSKDTVVNIPLDQLSAQLTKVESAIKGIGAFKEMKVPEFPNELNLSEVQINELLFAIQSIPEFPIKELEKMINSLGEKLKQDSVEIPEFDYDRLDRKLNELVRSIKNISITVSSGGIGNDTFNNGINKINTTLTDGSQKARLSDSNGDEVVLFDGSVPTISQDQHTDPVDLYFTKSIADTTLTVDAVVDATYVTVANTTGATAGKALTIFGSNSRLMQAIIMSVSGNNININVPVDKAYPAGSKVEFGEWNMNVDGSVTKQIFKMSPPPGIEWDVTRLIFSIQDDTAMDDGKFGGITYLTNGLVVRKTNGVKKNICVVNSNGGFAERCFDIRYSDKAPAGSYGFTAQKKFGGQDNSGVVVRLDGSSNDSLEIIIQDNLTALQKLAVTCQGHITQIF